MKRNFDVIVCDLPDYENLVAEMYIQGEFIGLLSQESGIGNFMVEFGSSVSSKEIAFADLHNVLEKAFQRLTSVG